MHFRNSEEGVGAIQKIRTIIKLVGMVAGVVFVAASFFVLRGYRYELFALGRRVEDLEYDRLLEAYRREGYEMD